MRRLALNAGHYLWANQKRTGILVLQSFFIFLVGTSFAGDAWLVHEDGVGPVKIGMTVAQLGAALHQELTADAKADHGCFFIDARGHDNISFMIIDGRVVRIDVRSPRVKTSDGIQLGDSEAKVRKVYGDRLAVTAHQYVDTGHYLTVRSADGRYGFRFETDKGKVEMFYAGKYDAIQYVEGCE
jgi:hypothetical protein